MSRIVTLAMATFGQPKMLAVQFDVIRSYPKVVLDQLELIIVDDHGKPPAEIPKDVQELLPCRLFRVLHQIHWNQCGARNLALQEATTPLILFVDPDMVIQAEMMARMIGAGAALSRGHVIRFMLKHKCSGILDSSSPNTWFMHVEDLRAVGGYDEDFAGNKGWSDCQLLDVIKANYKVHHTPDLYADFYSINEVPDAMVTTLDRSTKANKHKRLLRVKQARMMGGWKRWSRQQAGVPRVRFKWEQVV